MSQVLARRLRKAFVSYRINIEIACDPDESAAARRTAWMRAVNARGRVERLIGTIEQERIAG